MGLEGQWERAHGGADLLMVNPAITRRRLLKQGALAGCILGMPQLLFGRPGGGEAANDRIGVAVIGAGARGRANLKTLLGRGDVQVLAIADVEEGHRQEAKRQVDEAYGNGDAKTYEDYRELIAAGGVDVAVVAVPNHWHALIAIGCAEAGLDVYGEPPLAHTIVEGRAVCRAVARYGRVWQTGSHLRSAPLFQRACGYVASGRLGVTRLVEVGSYGGYVDLTGASKSRFFESAAGLNYDFWLGPANWLPYHPGRVHENWRWHQAFGGGQLMSWVGHYVDIALWALGLDQGGPVEMEATGEFPNHGIYNVPVKYDLKASFLNDLEMHVSSSLAPGIRWHGDEGWIYVCQGQLLASSPDLLQSEGADDWALVRFFQRGRDHWQDFFGGVRSRRPPVAPCESAHRAATIGHLGMLALNTGRTVSWDPEREEVLGDPQAAALLEVAYRKPWMLTD